MCNDWKRRTFMAVTLNQPAYEHAKKLIDEGRFVFDERDAWSEHQPSAMEESEYIRLHGFAEYGKRNLGVNGEKPENTKGTMSLPVGISRTSTVVAYTLQRAVPANTSITTSIMRRRTSWKDGRPQGCIGLEAVARSFRRKIGARSPHPVR
jgi:hypothetical protein